MDLNPYAHYLGSQNPLDVIEATPGKLQSLISAPSPAQLTHPPAPGKWSIRDIVCHLADTEIAFAFRLRQTLAEPAHVIQPFDQDNWSAPYGKLDIHRALDAFTAIRKWNLLLIQSASPESLQKPVTHPERGPMTFQTIVETMGGHDLNHLGQIEAAVRS